MDPAFESGQRDDAGVATETVPDDLSADVLDRLFDVLAAERRRHALRYLTAAERTVPLSELANHVATAESSNDYQQVAIDLHHRHLPKLAEEELISYDAEANLTTVTEDGRRFDAARASLVERDRQE
jgi:hypothetical protein